MVHARNSYRKVANMHTPKSIKELFPGSADADILNMFEICITPPSNGIGLLTALQGAVVALEALSQVQDFPGLPSLIDRLKSIRNIPVASLSDETRMSSMPSYKDISAPFALCLQIAASARSLRSDCWSEEALSVLGAVLLWHFQVGRKFPVSRAKQFLLLVTPGKGKQYKHWATVGKALSFNVDRMCEETDQCDNHDAKDLVRWITNIIHGAGNWGKPSWEKQDKKETPAIQKEDEDDDETPVDHAPALPKIGGSLVKWQFRRAGKMFSAGTAGLQEWNFLSPPELSQHAHRIAEQLKSEDVFTRNLAICAFLSLSAGLPIKLVLRLPFYENGDIWVDVENGEIVWDLTTIVDREEISAEIRASGYSPDHRVHCPLLLNVAEILKTIPGRQSTCLERLFPDTPEKAVVSRFGELLRDGCESDMRIPYSARWAYSLGATMSDDFIAAAYAALDFRHLSGAEPNYLCIPHARIYDALAKAYKSLGLGPVSGIRRDGYFGSPLAPRKEVLSNCLCKLSTAVGEIDPHNWGRMDFKAATTEFSIRARTIATLFVLLTGERGTALERRTAAAVWGHPEIAIIHDKGDDESQERPVPLISPLKKLLSLLRADIIHLGRIASREGLDIGNRLQRIGNGSRPNAPIFFSVLQKEGKWSLTPVKANDVRSILSAFGLARNGGRHFLLTELSKPEYPPYLRRAQSGHGPKLGRAFHLAGGVSPEVLMKELEIAIDGALPIDEMFYGWSFVASASDSFQLILMPGSPVRSTECKGLVAYAKRDKKNAGRGGLKFTLQSASMYAHAISIRRTTLEAGRNLEPAPAAIISLVLVDGVTDFALLNQIWDIFISHNAILVGQTPWTEIQLENGRARVFAPLPPTHLAFSELMTLSENGIPFHIAVEYAAKWLRSKFPLILWPEREEDVIRLLCKIGRHVDLFEMPPWIFSAGQSTLGAASVSLTSLARLYYKYPIKVTEVNRPTISRRKKRNLQGALQILTRFVNRIANPKRRFGEDRARKNRLLARVSLMESIVVLQLPMMDSVFDYLKEESGDNPVHGKPIVIGTIGSYLGELSSVLEARIHSHPLDFTEGDWEDIEGELKAIAENKNVQFDPSAFRRFARYWQSQGANTPLKLFVGDIDDLNKRSRWSTASTMIWSHEWHNIFGNILAGYPPKSVLWDIASAYLDLVREIPARANEVNYLRLVDLDEVNCQISILPSGFGHVKGGERSIGLISISRHLCVKLSGLRRRLRSLSPSRIYFFFSDVTPDNPDFVRLISQLSIALRRSTGEHECRRHSLRGGAECIQMIDGLEEFVTAHLLMGETFIVPELGMEVGISGWRNVVRVAAQARHHTLTAVSSYLVVWVLIARHLRLLQLGKIWPGEILGRWGKISAGAIRVARHRANGVRGDAGRLWLRLAGNTEVGKLGRSRICMNDVPHLDVDCLIPEFNGTTVFPSAERLARELWCGGLVALGMENELAADITLVNWPSKCTSLPNGLFRTGGDSLRLARQMGFNVAQKLVSVLDYDHFRAASNAIACAKRGKSVSGSELLKTACILQSLLPQGWKIGLLPESGGLPHGIEPEIRSRCEGITIKLASVNPLRRYRFTVRHDERSKSPRTEGAATAVLAVFLDVALAFGEAGAFEEIVNG